MLTQKCIVFGDKSQVKFIASFGYFYICGAFWGVW